MNEDSTTLPKSDEQAFIDSFGLDYKGVDENGDTKDPYHEGYNDGIDAFAAKLRVFYRKNLKPSFERLHGIKRAAINDSVSELFMHIDGLHARLTGNEVCAECHQTESRKRTEAPPVLLKGDTKMQTVGELRVALAACPDSTPLAVLIDSAAAKLIDGEVYASGRFEVDRDENGVTITGV